MSSSVVASNVRAELAARAENQAVLAELLDLTHSSISRRLRGETPFRDHEVGAIAAHFQMSVASLYQPRLRVVHDDDEIASESRQRPAQRRESVVVHPRRNGKNTAARARGGG